MQSACIEILNSRFWDEFLNLELFGSLSKRRCSEKITALATTTSAYISCWANKRQPSKRPAKKLIG